MGVDWQGEEGGEAEGERQGGWPEISSDRGVCLAEEPCEGGRTDSKSDTAGRHLHLPANCSSASAVDCQVCLSSFFYTHTHTVYTCNVLMGSMLSFANTKS